MTEPHQEYLRRGTTVRSDMTIEERRDAARRRLDLATQELKDRVSPAKAVRRNPVVIVGGAVAAGFLISRLRGGRRAERVRIVYRDREVPVARASSKQQTEEAAEKAANKSSLRTLIFSALGTALIGILRDRILKPNLERWTDDALHRLGFGGGDRPGAPPAPARGPDRRY